MPKTPTRARANSTARRAAPTESIVADDTAPQPNDAWRAPLAAGSGAPLYRRVVGELRNEILRGVYPVGSHLPSESELSERFAVSRHTVREALRELRNSGLVSSRRGSGTTVISAARAQTYVHDTGSFADLLQYVSARWIIHHNGLVNIDEVTASRLEAEPGTPWVRVQGVRFESDPALPSPWTQFYLHSDYAQIARLIGKTDRPNHDLIHDLYGEHVGEVEQNIWIEVVAPHIATLLKIEPGSMVVNIERLFRLASGKPVQLSLSLLPASQFRFSIKLKRSPSEM